MDNLHPTHTIRTTVGDSCNFVNLVKKFAAKGYILDDGGTPKHPKKYACVTCKEEQTRNAGKDARPEALKNAYTKAFLFKRNDGMQCLACCAGHRRFLIPNSHPKYNEIMATFDSKKASAKTVIPATKVTTQPPDSDSNITYLMETVSAAAMGVVIDY